LADEFNDRGVAHQAKGQRDQAIADCSEAIRLNPQFAKAFYTRGLIFETKGDTAPALADFETYQHLVPNDPEASAAIARVKKQKPRE
jgi:tetratricopeptide (TPR) repeat protein